MEDRSLAVAARTVRIDAVPYAEDSPVSPDQLTDTTVAHGFDEGVALALKAEESGDWKAVADWLARNAAHARDLADFLADQRKIPRVSPPGRTGAAFGGLELREQIGAGAMGVVYRALDPLLKRDVAVKLLRTGRELSADEAARFRYEAEVVASLTHPNVVPVLSSGEVNGEPYLVMPLMEGSLAKRLKDLGPDRCLKADEAATLVRDIALGVHHAHQRGLIHRDLKPGNILLDATSRPHVADFGLARPADATASTAAGTPAYMAPEQARGEKHLTTAVDVHALGAILFELLTGGPPFGSDNVASVIRRVIEEPAPLVRTFRPDAPCDLEAICLKCLEKNPGKRYSSAQALADDLTRFLKGEAVTAHQPGFWDWLGQLARTRPEQNPNYSWQVLVWFGWIGLIGNGVIFNAVRDGWSAAWIWGANVAAGAAMLLVLWWYMLRRFRQLPVTERHSLVLAFGLILAYFPLMAAYVPLSATTPARDGLGFYPALAAVSAMCLFTLGSTNWSRFFLIGTAYMALVPVLARWPEASPLIIGAAWAAVMWYWAYIKGVIFSRVPDPR